MLRCMTARCSLCFLICLAMTCMSLVVFFFFQAEDGIRDLVRSRGLGDVYKRQVSYFAIIFNISLNNELL